MKDYVDKIVREARASSYPLGQLSSSVKNDILRKMAVRLEKEASYIIRENARDIAAAKKRKAKKSFIDRLALDKKRIAEMACSLSSIAELPDPLGKVLKKRTLANGLVLRKVRVPLGVLLIIYEARPNVTSDCIGLCFKTGNVAILRGGKDALASNKAVYTVLCRAVSQAGLGYRPFFLVEKTDHRVVDILLKQDQYIDLVIPRGGEALVRKVVELSTLPVIKHYKGVCHIFVDESADLKKALKICLNAKCQRPSVCNAVETILVHKKIAAVFLPRLKKKLDLCRVRIKGDEQTRALLKGVSRAVEADWFEEYLDLIVSIKVVDDISQAIEHINLYGSHHTDSILTENAARARRFTREVDSACCFVNISTRFSDGYQFGLGAEIGISTDKLHARGPMGLEELTTYKYVVEGDGQIRT